MSTLDMPTIDQNQLSDDTKHQLKKIMSLFASMTFWLGFGVGILAFALFGSNLFLIGLGYLAFRAWTRTKESMTKDKIT